jgi:hypothetical protein
LICRRLITPQGVHAVCYLGRATAAALGEPLPPAEVAEWDPPTKV